MQWPVASAQHFLLAFDHCHLLGAVAQLGEHLLCKQGVTGSSPVSSTSSCQPALPGIERPEGFGALNFEQQDSLNLPRRDDGASRRRRCLTTE